jgi:hypothetical protein
MDKMNRYRTLIKEHLELLERYSREQPVKGMETICAFDERRDHYLLLSVGWSPKRRVCGATIYARLKDEKIWIEQDWTEEGLATVLINAGVPKSDIVLAFHSPEMRKLTEFAVA